MLSHSPPLCLYIHRKNQCMKSLHECIPCHWLHAMLQYQFSLDCDWLQPYIPHSLTHAALILADHVDFWEEDAFRLPNGLYRQRYLTEFLKGGCAANQKMKPRFRELLKEYVALAENNGTVRPRPGDQPFQITRRHSVQIAVADVRMWLDSESVIGPHLFAGQKRLRNC